MAAEDNSSDSLETFKSVKSEDDYATTGELPAVLVSPGDVLAGKYEVEEIIGRGGMGIVVAARHMQLHERVALKLLLPSATQTEEFSQRFMREAQVTAKLRSEHIARVTDVGILDNGSPYMIMEYLQGQDLRQVLRGGGPLPVSTAIEYIVQACEGMAEAHSYGIVHRDLKPSNLFLTQRRDGSDLIKVLDFGISKALLREDIESRDLTSAGALLGSPRYMSPEQLQDTALVDSRADVWSLATMLYEMLAGRPPFAERTHAATCVRVLGTEPPASLMSRRPEVPELLETAIFQALERDPDQRTPDVAAFASSLLEASTDLVAPSVEVSVARIHGMVDATNSGRPNAISGSNVLPKIAKVREVSVPSSRTPGAWADGEGAKRKGRVWPKLAVGAVVLLLLFGSYQLWLRPTEVAGASAIGPLPSATIASATASATTAAFAVTVDAEPPPEPSEPDAVADASGQDAAAAAPTKRVPRTYVPPPRRPPPPPPKQTATAQQKKPGDILESRQ